MANIPASFEAFEPDTDPVSDAKSAELSINTLFSEMSCELGVTSTFLPEHAARVFEIVFEAENSGIGAYSAAMKLGYNDSDWDDRIIMGTAERFMNANTEG